jgi:hypothetical protein
MGPLQTVRPIFWVRTMRPRRKVLLYQGLEDGVDGPDVYGAVVQVRVAWNRHVDAWDQVVPDRAAGEQARGEQENGDEDLLQFVLHRRPSVYDHRNPFYAPLV